jgi:serine/threonine kinase 32
MKYINKAKCIQQKMVDSIIGERLLLEEISSLFVVNLRYAFQDTESMYMVIDLMTGGDLRFHLDQGNKIDNELVKFWMAELSYALSVIHSRNIMHRDMKPDVRKSL